MSKELDKLRNAFLAAAHKGGPPALYDATVLEIDAEAYTCDVEMDGVPLYNVRLRAVVSENNSIEILPEVGAAIVVGRLADDDFLMVACDKMTSWRVKVNNTAVGVDAGGVTISQGTETLNKIMTDLVKAVIGIAAPKDAATLTLLLTRIKTLLK
jgi:hypothetical protein